MVQYHVYDRMSTSATVGHLRMITSDREKVDELIDGDDWRYVVIAKESWVNSPCAYGCDCGECYSRSPDDETPHHCVTRQPVD